MLRKPIRNPPDTPWLTWILEGKKKYEGRLSTKIVEWDLYIGKEAIFECGSLKAHARITSLLRYDSFGHAFDTLGSELVPIDGITRVEVEDLYRRYYSREDVEKHGVVAIGIVVIKSQDYPR